MYGNIFSSKKFLKFTALEDLLIILKPKIFSLVMASVNVFLFRTGVIILVILAPFLLQPTLGLICVSKLDSSILIILSFPIFSTFLINSFISFLIFFLGDIFVIYFFVSNIVLF
jgi:hypothetical protein